MLRRLMIILTAALASGAVHALFGAELLCTVSSRETYVGASVRIQVIIKDTRVYEPPVFPDVDGAEVRELREEVEEYPTVRSPVRGEGYTVTYTYMVIPRRAGTLSIPPIRVTADGALFSTSPMRIVAKESKAGDLLRLELVGERQYIYIGESLDVTLEIWLKPYRGKDIRLDAEDMWRYAIDEGGSTWGPFAENLQDRPPSITYRSDTRRGTNGDARRYFVYSLSREVWPRHPGLFDADGVTVAVNYPLKMRQKRATLLGRPFQIVESRPISAKVEDPKILVKPPPVEGRPDTFRGAVGEYTMTVTASPVDVSVGDPITLTLTISGSGQMNLLQAPLLAEQDSLTVDFRLPDEELPGTVSDTAKEFSQTIRAKHDAVTEIPPIRFSYFDPREERYVTLSSEPIPLEVEESSWLVTPQLVDGNALGGGRTSLTVAKSGLPANYGDVEALLSRQSFSFGWGTWGVAVSGPLFCMLCFLLRRRHDRLVGDSGLRRRRSARRTALAAIRHATAEVDGVAAAASIATALAGYVADRRNLPPGGETRAEVISQLRSRNLPERVISELDRLLAECEGVQYGGGKHASAKDLSVRARVCIDELEGQRL